MNCNEQSSLSNSKQSKVHVETKNEKEQIFDKISKGYNVSIAKFSNNNSVNRINDSLSSVVSCSSKAKKLSTKEWAVRKRKQRETQRVLNEKKLKQSWAAEKRFNSRNYCNISRGNCY